MGKPGESVAKTLRRLGGGKSAMSASQRWKKKKAGAQEDPKEKLNRENMLKLTGLADGILTRSGKMEIYEETYESIMHKVKTEEEKKLGPKTAIPEGVNDDDALDMFADSLDDKSEATESKSEPVEEKINKHHKPRHLTQISVMMFDGSLSGKRRTLKFLVLIQVSQCWTGKKMDTLVMESSSGS